MATEKFKNAAFSSLSAAINNCVTKIQVADGSVFPTAGNFRVTIDSEIILVTARETNLLIVVRAQEGTQASSHAAGAGVALLLTKGSLDQWLLDARAYDTANNQSVSGEAGRLYIPNDGCSFAIDTGSTWQHFSTPGGFKTNLTPPVSSNFSWVNQGSSTLDTTRGGVQLNIPAGAGTNYRGRYVAKTAPWKVTMHFVPFLADVNYPLCGLGFYDSVAGKIVGQHLVNSGHIHYLEGIKQTNVTTFSSEPFLLVASNAGHKITWLQIEDNNTNIYFRYSCNGKMWITAYSESRTSFITGGPTGAMFYACPTNATYGCSMHVLHWLEE